MNEERATPRAGPGEPASGAAGGGTNARIRARLQMHACVFLWGFTAILGKLIRLPALPLVGWRMAMVVGVLAWVPSVRRDVRTMPARRRLAYGGAGLLLTLHWVAFYGSVKLANASVAATCLALAPVAVSLIEPWTSGRRFDPRELLLGAMVVPGVALVVGGVPAGMRVGLAVGVLSAVLVALFWILNKRFVDDAHPLTITFVEVGAGFAGIALLVPLELVGVSVLPLPDVHDAILLALLATAFTLLPFALSLAALRHLSTYEVQLAVNLEPVYSVVLAVVLLGEQGQLRPAFYGGVAILVGAVLVSPRLGKRP